MWRIAMCHIETYMIECVYNEVVEETEFGGLGMQRKKNGENRDVLNRSE